MQGLPRRFDSQPVRHTLLSANFPSPGTGGARRQQTQYKVNGDG
jgi:hypothetical protein